MNGLLRFLGDFAVGFARGFAGSQAEPPAAGRHSELRGYDFREHMQMLGRESPYPLVSVRQQRAMFNVTVDGRSYMAITVLRGEIITVGVCSLITFPPGRAPAEICRVLEQRNRELKSCDFGLIDDADGAFFYIYGQINCAALTPAAFNAAVAELAPRIGGLDQYLMENGYAR